jgi:hypothetical protein
MIIFLLMSPVVDQRHRRMKERTTVILHVQDMMKLIKIGQWYVEGQQLPLLLFFPFNQQMSEEAEILMLFLKRPHALSFRLRPRATIERPNTHRNRV